MRAELVTDKAEDIIYVRTVYEGYFKYPQKSNPRLLVVSWRQHQSPT